MLHTLQTLLPVFAVIALGYGLARKGFHSKVFLDELNRLVYWVCLPALIVTSLDRSKSLSVEAIPIILIYFAATICVLGLSAILTRWLGLQRWQHGTFMQGSFRGNLAFIGLPILIYALREQDEAAINAVVAQAVFIFAPTMILYNVLSVFVLLGGHDGTTARSLPKTLGNMAKNPLILAALTGLLFYLLPIDLPSAVGDTLQFIGRMAAPAALICVGGGMALTSMEGRYRSATFAACLKVFATPLFAYLISMPFDISENGKLILMIFSATPTAVASYIMVKEMQGDAPMASGAIVLSTLFSVISLGIVLSIF